MRSSKILVVLAVAFLIVARPNVAVSQDKATAQEVVAKVKEAASALSKTGDLAQFNQKQSPWVWKDTYIFVEDCDKNVMAAHPLKPELGLVRCSEEAFRRLDRILVGEAR